MMEFASINDGISEKLMILGLFISWIISSILFWGLSLLFFYDIFYVDFILSGALIMMFYCGWLTRREYILKKYREAQKEE